MTRCNREKGSHRRESISRRASRRLSSLPLRRSSLSLSLVYLFFSRLSSPFGRSVMLAFLDPASLLVSWKLISLDEKGLRGKFVFLGGKRDPGWKGCCRSFFTDEDGALLPLILDLVSHGYFHRTSENE